MNSEVKSFIGGIVIGSMLGMAATLLFVPREGRPSSVCENKGGTYINNKCFQLQELK